MKSPENLKNGDLVGIIPPAKSIDPLIVDKAVKIIESWGLRVRLSENIGDKFYLFAGRDPIRTSSFQDLLDSEDVKCIFCARGGYGTTRIIDSLDFEKFQTFPKWIVGYSDITVLLLRLNHLGFQGIHGPMPLNFPEPDAEESIERLRKFLFEGQIEPVHIEVNRHNISGMAQGMLMGGNLSMLVNVLGTPDDFTTEGKILMIEEVDEYLYRIDRMLVQLKRSGKLENLAGLILGHFSQIKHNDEPYGSGIEEIFLDLTSDYNYPICFGAPFGHLMPNYPVPLGNNFQLEVSSTKAILTPLKD